jgi:hypothetical protein
MKKLIILVLISIASSSSSYSQEVITYKNGGKVFNSNNIKLTPDEYRSLLSTNQTALDLYNSGRTKKIVGSVLLYGGISTLIIKHLSMVNKYKTSNNPNQNAKSIL